MSHHLGELLQQAVPEPTRYLDPDEIMRASQRGGSVPRWAGPLVAVVVLVSASVIVGPRMLQSDVGPAAPKVADVPLHLSALEHRVPLGETAAGSLEPTVLVHPSEGVLVASLDAAEPATPSWMPR